MDLNKIYHGNNLDILKTFEDNSIDSIVTDPPYGLGKEPNALEVLQSWITTGYHEIKGKGFMGKEWDSFVPQPVFWKECLRVLKPGGHLLSFAGTRTYDWVVMGLRIAGFEIRDQIAWVYGSGFPKSLDVSKAIDKSMGAERTKKIEKVRNPKTTGNGHDGTKGATRPFIEKALKENGGLYEIDDNNPVSDEAKQWQGWGTALKPALEPIVMARKPLDGTVASNVLKHGVGGINIDGCRVETSESDKYDIRHYTNEDCFINNKPKVSEFQVKPKNDLGRFPANFIHDGSDEVVKLFPSVGEGNGNPYNYSGVTYDNKNTSMFNGDKPQAPSNYNDSGSAARFFYTPKASQTERNFGLSGFEEDVTTDGRNKPIDNAYNRGKTKRKNIHPTVKPIDLMRYLVRLVTPKNGICLDPYMGSGTTAVACKAEKINYVGCELDAEYIKIAESRIKSEVVMYDIFDFGA